MSTAEIAQRLAETTRLYEGGLSITEIAAKIGISRQAVHLRLTKAGVKIPTLAGKPVRQIDRETLLQLYVDEQLPVSKVAKRLRTTHDKVVRELERHAIERRPRRVEIRIKSPLDNLMIGEFVIVPITNVDQPYERYYSLASVRKIKVSIRRFDVSHMKVTRIA